MEVDEAEPKAKVEEEKTKTETQEEKVSTLVNESQPEGEASTKPLDVKETGEVDDESAPKKEKEKEGGAEAGEQADAELLSLKELATALESEENEEEPKGDEKEKDKGPDPGPSSGFDEMLGDVTEGQPEGQAVDQVTRTASPASGSSSSATLTPEQNQIVVEAEQAHEGQDVQMEDVNLSESSPKPVFTGKSSEDLLQEKNEEKTEESSKLDQPKKSDGTDATDVADAIIKSNYSAPASDSKATDPAADPKTTAKTKGRLSIPPLFQNTSGKAPKPAEPFLSRSGRNLDPIPMAPRGKREEANTSSGGYPKSGSQTEDNAPAASTTENDRKIEASTGHTTEGMTVKQRMALFEKKFKSLDPKDLE